MSLALLTLSLLSASPAQAQQYPGSGGWNVTDQAGNPISPNQDGSGYPLCGTLTGSAPTGAYPDVFADASQPSPPINYAFIPNLWSGQYWLYTGDPCPMSASVWTMASAANNVSTRGGGVAGYLSDYHNENVVGSITPTTGGTLWATFTGQGQSVPDHIDLLLTTTVQASASVNLVPSQYLSATATATDSLNETAQASADGSGGGVPLVTGRHLLRVAVDPQTQQAQVSLGGTATATATDLLPYGAFYGDPPGYYATGIGPATATASASISAAAKTDSRDLIIKCFDIEDSSHAGPFNTATLNYPPDVRAGDGSIVTDSAVAPPSPPNQAGGSTTWTAGPTLWAQATAFQSPTFAWSVSGAGSSSAGNSNHTVLSESFPVSTTGNALNQQSTAQVTVTDSDGATAANTYTIRWHYPYENWQANGPSFQNPPKPYHSTDGPQGANGQVHIPVSSAGIDWSAAGHVGGGVLTTAATVVGVAAPETDPIILGFLSASGYTLGEVGPPPPPTSYSKDGTLQQFQSDVSTEMSIVAGNTSGVFLPSQPRMDPKLASDVSSTGNYGDYFGGSGGSLTFDVTAYRLQWQQNFTGDSYGLKGYTGPAPGYVQWEGRWNYIWNWTWTPSGTPGH